MSKVLPVIDAFYSPGQDAVLHCPSCGHGNLYHLGIEVYARRKQDAVTNILFIDGYTGAVRTEEDTVGANPSTRRHAVIIGFRCALCPARPELGIIQHSGASFVEWIWPPAPLMGAGVTHFLRRYLPRNWWRRS